MKKYKVNQKDIKKCASNSMKIKMAHRKGVLSLIGLFAFMFIVAIAIVNPHNVMGLLLCIGTANTALAAIPFMVNVKIKKGEHGYNEDETEQQYLQRKEAHEAALEIKSWITDKLKEFKDTDPEFKALTEMKSSLEKAPKADDLKAVNDKLEILGMAVKSIQNKGKQGSVLPIGLKGVLNNFIKENAATILELKRAGKGEIRLDLRLNADNEIMQLEEKNGGFVELKAVGAMIDGSATSPTTPPNLVGVQMAPPTRINYRTSIVDGLVSTLNTSLAAYPYTQSIPKDGNYTFVLEGGTKPQVDFKIQTYYATPNKVAAYMELTEESITDIPGLQSIAYDMLRSRHDLEKQAGILSGNGSSPNPLGAFNIAKPFSAGSMAGTVPYANIKDVICAMLTQIFTTHNFNNELPYQANLVLMHPIDFFTRVIGAKDNLGRQLFPEAALFNRLDIGGATVIPFEGFDDAGNIINPVGYIFAADMNKYITTNYVGYTVRIGWINEDFINNQFAIVGESRFHAFVKLLDQVAFVYDQISTIEAAILYVPAP